MILLPAIDLKDGECVRLFQGDYSTARRVAEDALETAHAFREAGAEWLHVVDLNGAKAAKPVNADLMFRIRKTSGLRLEVGGGIRDMETVDFYLKNGISRVILGTAAVTSPELVVSAVEKYGDRIAVGVDARDGMVAQKGWTETSSIDYLSMAKHMELVGVKYIIFTDISRDGTLTGPNLSMLKQLQNSVSCRIIASGGVSGLKDIKDLRDLKLYGAICGKSLYSGGLDLREAVALCGKTEGD
ncbi:1-(5-phosphoribosyl)-5-[(5-phosphoribosylamino)methylideneamino]imidazole-4-carboxamide isomerase [Caproiciproducens sp. NJN-50]|uniref:1-(5-phosphoribosyl)-5-[(5- phosphoribosylamino)methylideneamino]imidazole-4- carboxamide isomerase n=1 Tax=Acutalibacteraceae TaxID=3082771 RepID=UPI000FFE056F|nr:MULTISPECIES: 1-(5-phosphoribosyl)-5-[(5-phosphoribosylamino)methylideneamino]imidazole-4-carboxamide isomerase [Acutalibacteraceae]QAT49740.1 1-(5-phosphoribosyl)-5-[(5-phosphoribosylamino)methylideneamino]imidazole-4-carboxamide isomerase [Caproiciproducens sp. NJN-50]